MDNIEWNKRPWIVSDDGPGFDCGGFRSKRKHFVREEEYRYILFCDHDKDFISLVGAETEREPFSGCPQDLLMEVCFFHSVKCAAALINGATPLSVDLNLPCSDGSFPLHHAARFYDPGITELFLFHGAQPDVRCSCDHFPLYRHDLPLQSLLRNLESLEILSQSYCPSSVFTLISALCLPRMQNELETLELLAWKTKQTEELFADHVRWGNGHIVAALLLVARKKLTKPIMFFRESFPSLQCNGLLYEEALHCWLFSMMRLIDLFDIAGDEIEAYAKEEKTGVSQRENVEKLRGVLRKAGLAVGCFNNKFSHPFGYMDYWVKDTLYSKSLRMEPMDIGMPHYATSGHRWTGNHGEGRDLESDEKPKPVADALNKLLAIQNLGTYPSGISFSTNNKPSWAPFAWIFEWKEANSLKMSEWIPSNEGHGIDCGGIQSNRKYFVREKEYRHILLSDNEKRFISLVNAEREHFSLCPQDLLMEICFCHSVKCAAALLNGDTPLSVDVNLPCSGGSFPLHHAARFYDPSMAELFLYHGAQADARCPSDDLPLYKQDLPLDILLRQLANDVAVWDPNFIDKLITVLCLPGMQNALETLEMLAWKTKQIEKAFDSSVRSGRTPLVAALLLVAREKLTNSIMSFRETFPLLQHDVEEHREAMIAVMKVIDLFDNLGDDISAYAKEEKTGVSREKIMEEVRDLLRKGDLVVGDYDAYWTPSECHMDNFFKSKNWRMKPRDIGMPHYGTSGHRWTGCLRGGGIYGSNEKPTPAALLSNRLRAGHNVRNYSSWGNLTPSIGAEPKNKMKGAELSFSNMGPSSKPWASFASIFKQMFKRI